LRQIDRAASLPGSGPVVRVISPKHFHSQRHNSRAHPRLHRRACTRMGNDHRSRRYRLQGYARVSTLQPSTWFLCCVFKSATLLGATPGGRCLVRVKLVSANVGKFTNQNRSPMFVCYAISLFPHHA